MGMYVREYFIDTSMLNDICLHQEKQGTIYIIYLAFASIRASNNRYLHNVIVFLVLAHIFRPSFLYSMS